MARAGFVWYRGFMSADAQNGSPPRKAPVTAQHHGYKQQRSLKTFERLLEAAEALSAERAFADISVQDICDRAELSVGAFYRRFKSKDGLLQVLHERYTERALDLQARALDPRRWENVPLDQIIARVIDEIFETTQRDLGLIRASTRRAQFDEHIAHRDAQIQGEFLALMTRLLLQRVELIDHPQPRIAAEFCAYEIRAVITYYFLTSPLDEIAGRSLTESQVRRELVASMLRYLRVASPSETAAAPAPAAIES